jgi:hypothetical protein
MSKLFTKKAASVAGGRFVERSLAANKIVQS